MSLDVLIVGAGPAGVSAGLWARELGLNATVVESAAVPGGQLQHVHFAPRDVAGVQADDGPAIAMRYALQLADAGVPLVSERMAASLELANEATGGPWRSVHEWRADAGARRFDRDGSASAPTRDPR